MKNYITKRTILIAGCSMLVLFALGIRFTLLPIQSGDYVFFIKPWYDFIQAHGLHSFKYNFANYNLPYLYLLYCVSLFHFPEIAAIKAVSIFFDLILSLAVYLIVKVYRGHKLALLAGVATLFLPTVILNSSVWGQCDSIYAAFLMFSIYFGIKEKGAWAWISWGLAFSFKLQAVFLLPWLISLWLRGHTKWYTPLLSLPIIAALDMPAVIAGRSLRSIASIYASQIGFYPQLTYNAPTLYQWVPNTMYAYFNHAGLLLAMATATILVMSHYLSGRYDSHSLALFAVLVLFVIPFFLPQMHERYFYAAEIASFILAFIDRRFVWVAAIMQLISFFTYGVFLYNSPSPIPLPILSVIVLIIIFYLSHAMSIKLKRQR